MRTIMVEDSVVDIEVNKGRAFFLWRDEAGSVLGQVTYSPGVPLSVARRFPPNDDIVRKLASLSCRVLANPEIFDFSGDYVALVSEGAHPLEERKLERSTYDRAAKLRQVCGPESNEGSGAGSGLGS